MAELSGFEVLALVKEIGSSLRGTYVNNVYSLGDAQLIRFRKPGGEDAWLVVSPSLGAWVSEKVSERAETTELTTRLRGQLERARFEGAGQVDLDRVFDLAFGGGGLTKRLIVELMPPGNLIIADGEGKILVLKDEVRSPGRRILKGGVYAPPPQRRLSPSAVGPDQVREMAKAEKTVGKAIGKHVSIPRKYIAEALYRLSLEEGAPSSLLEGRESEVVDVLQAMVREAGESPNPCICETPWGDEIFVFAPHAFKVKRESASISALCDELFLGKAVQEASSEESPGDRKRRELEVTVSKLKAEEESLLAEASRLRKAAAVASHATSVLEAKKLLAEAGLKTRKEVGSVAAAASMLYDGAKEVEEKVADVGEAMRRLSKKAPRVEKGGRPPTKKLARRKQEWYEKFRWFFTSEGKLAIGGRDAHSNSIMVRRHIDDNDVVYHADLFGSPFFVLKGGRDQTEPEVREVAQATVAFSSAWKTGLGTADAYWVNPDQVATAAPSGEYLPRGSFSIIGKKNFVTKNFVEVAVGLDEKGRVVAGPEAALKKGARLYVVLKPHKEKGSETAKRVLKDLESLGWSGAGAGVSLDDVLRALPAGGGKVVRTVGEAERSEDL